MTIRDFAESIIHDPGGMIDLERQTNTEWRDDIRVATVAWTLRCLAIPELPGSQEILDLINKQRATVAGGLNERRDQ